MKLLVDEVRKGRVKKEHLKMMVMRMGGAVHGVYVETCDKETDLQCVIM